MIDNNIKTHDLFTVFLSKIKFYYLKYDFVNFNFYQKNIIQISDMKYLLKNIDTDYLKIILKHFSLSSDFFSNIICEYLKIEKIDHVKICIEYLFLKFFWKINPGLKSGVRSSRAGVWTPALGPQGSHPAVNGEVSLCSMKERIK